MKVLGTLTAKGCLRKTLVCYLMGLITSGIWVKINHKYLLPSSVLSLKPVMGLEALGALGWNTMIDHES